MSAKASKLYEGKAKILYQGEQPDRCLHYFKDSATAFNGEKKEEFEGKGKLNAAITSKLFSFLESHQVRTHFIRQIDERTLETWSLQMLPVEVVVRNRIAGSIAKRLPKFAGHELAKPIVEWYLKDDEQKDPQVSEDLLQTLFSIAKTDLDEMRTQALRVNELLSEYFLKRKLILIDFKLEFGKDAAKNLLLADEISPDTCRLWDADTLEKFDKDRFRLSLGDLLEGYREIWRRMNDA